MLRTLWTGFALLLAASSTSLAAGFAHNANFLVFAPAEPDQESGQAMAEAVLAEAEALRAAIAAEWLADEIPPGIGRTVINVSYSDTQDTGLTWAKDDPARTFHNVYLKTSPSRVLGGPLRHEIAHVVLATRFAHPNRLPAWIDEGIASTYDDDDRVMIRQRTIEWYAKRGNFPAISPVVRAEAISASDQAAYAVASSLTEFLLSRKNKATFLEFLTATPKEGWENALRRVYGFQSVADFESAWKTWVSQPDHLAQYTPTVRAPR